MPQQTERAIKFFFLTQGITLRNRNKLKHYLKDMLKKEGKGLGYMNFIFCSDAYLLEINRRFLGHDYFTDIVTFDYSENLRSVQAEIYISVDRVKDNALNLGCTFKSEVSRVIFHGVLHLCGYKDKSEAEKNNMRKKEDHYLKNYK